MVHLHDDSAFYGLAAEMAEICQAISRCSTPATADAILKHTMNLPHEQDPQVEDTAPDPILLELENIMIQEFFSLPFVYQPLDEPRAFRILVLHPGSPCEPLRGTIQHTTVTAGTSYEAISYAWGDGSKPCSILLDGCQMSLTQSLFNALVRLRYLKQDRKLWADGLCINQADNKEKGVQVSLMTDIYTYARKVLVHLGLEADGSELLPDLLERLGKVDIGRIREREMTPEEYLYNGLPSPDSGLWKALVAFLCRPWFLRVWVIQELVLARDIRFFCGDWKLRWGLLAGLAERFKLVRINKHLLTWNPHEFDKARHATLSLATMLALHLTRSVVAKRLELLRKDIESIPLLTSERSHIEGLAPDLVSKWEFIVQSCREHRQLYPALERTIFTFDGIEPPSTPILKLLGLFARNEATNPQDRLYALIGLAADINLEEFRPDYGENADETNARFGRKLVEKGQGMDLLFHATKLSLELQNLSFPSWAPNWSPSRSQDNHWLKLGWAYNQYSGGFNGRPDSSSYVSLVDGAPNVVRVTGFRVDRLETVVKLFDDPRDYKLSNFAAASKRFFRQCEEVMNGGLYITGESWPEVLCRTLIADHVDWEQNSFSDLIQQYEETKSLSAILSHSRQGKLMNSWGNAWFGLMPEYALCKTNKGYIGLVPQATSIIDEIFMFQGSDLPFVLRPLRSLPGFYRFVGGCYIHGLMKGEAWKLEQTRSNIFLL
jgi:hypothetical protein